MSPPLVSFVIATMNRKKDLGLCLESITRQAYPNIEIVVVDNGSSDGTPEFIRDQFPHISLIALDKNAGAAGGKSVGLQRARGAFIIQLDDDETFPDTNVCETVIAYFEQRPEVGVLSFNILDPTTHETASKTIPRRDKRMLYEDTPCGYFLGGGCAFRSSVLREVGCYWEKLNPYGSEEFDLSYRIIEHGYSILWTKNVRIYHHESPVARASGRRTYYETRNRVWVALKHLPWFYVFTNLVAWWGYGGLIALRSGTLRSYLTGIKDCVSGMPSAYKERKVIDKRTIEVLKKYSGPLYY
jgi:GT2 family glycosyltransferase